MREPQKKGRIFILGVSGYLGYNLALSLRHKYSIIGCYFTNPVSIPDVHTYPLDLSAKDLLERMLRNFRPDFTIMASGINDPVACRQNPQSNDAINVVLPLALAQGAVAVGAKNIHLSCAQVFDGSSGQSPETAKNFSNLSFGRAKATSESYIRAQAMENTTLRFGRVLGIGSYNRPSIFDRFRESVAAGEKHLVLDDKRFNFLSMKSFLDGVERLLEGPFPPTHRIFHLGGVAMQEINMYKRLAEMLGVDSQLVRQKQAAVEDENFRPAFSRDYTLDCSKFSKDYGWQPETEDQLFKNLQESMTPASLRGTPRI